MRNLMTVVLLFVFAFFACEHAHIAVPLTEHIRHFAEILHLNHAGFPIAIGMAQQTWTYDAPTGVYKNHTLSSDLRQAAIVDTKFMQFVKPEAGYGRKKGDTITITRVSNLAVPSDGKISETTRIPEDVLTISTVGITVSEWGRSVPYTSLSEDLSEFNIENSVQAALKNQMKVVMDNASSSAFKTGQIKAEATGTTSINFDTGGSPTQQATVNLNLYHIEQMRDYAYSTLFIPPFEGDDYILTAATKACRGIKQDPNWETWHKYTDPEAKYNAEIGRMENCRVVEVPNVNALAAVVGTSSGTGEAILFGMDPVVMAVAQDPELRLAIPQDFGRQRSVAWYGILNFGVVWTTANPGEARIIHFTST